MKSDGKSGRNSDRESKGAAPAGGIKTEETERQLRIRSGLRSLIRRNTAAARSGERLSSRTQNYRTRGKTLWQLQLHR